MYVFLKFIILFSGLQLGNCERAPTWDFCKCNWETWKPWSSCTSTCGGGRQSRDRRVWHRDIPRCDGFEKCATSGSGWEWRGCNQLCLNGGTFNKISSTFGLCNCKKGTKGQCCDQIVDCGQPSSISHGKHHYSKHTYGNIVSYTCDVDYNMTDPSKERRTCTEYGYWSGMSPTCQYAQSCKSNPCRNNATCNNLLGDYMCNCTSGWSGKNCELDIQPPIFDVCPKNKSIVTSNITHTETWSKPAFTDPHGTDVVLTKNYETSSFIFPWGNHVVQYTATKPSNGLTTECSFYITVKPNPCEPLLVPENGILTCNNWQTDYATVCKLFCKRDYAWPQGFSEDDIYTCAASGHWFPSSKLHRCIPADIRVKGTSVSAITCNDQNDKDMIAKKYIESLKASVFNDLCENHLTECQIKNVNVKC